MRGSGSATLTPVDQENGPELRGSFDVGLDAESGWWLAQHDRLVRALSA